MTDTGGAEESSYEIVSFICKEAYVYQVPPARSSAGHRADDWNVEKWLTEVRVRVVEAGDTCTVKLESPQNGELFAACPVPTDKPLVTAVEPVIDSSRYFVLRVVDTTGAAPRQGGKAPAHAFIGLGFAERSQAYDFTAALQDFVKRMERQRQAERAAAEHQDEEEEASAGPAKPKVDMALKPGQTIRLELSGKRQLRNSITAEKMAELGLGQRPPSRGASGASLPPPGTTPRSLTPAEGAPRPALGLAPPPPAPSMGLSPPPAGPGRSDASATSASSADAEPQSAPPAGPAEASEVPMPEVQSLNISGDTSGKSSAVVDDDDDFGDFVSG